MKAGTSVQVMKTIVGNPVTRKVLSGMSKFCEVDGKNRLEVALELYVGEREDACRFCRLAERPLASVLKRGAKSFGITEEDMKKTFKNPYWRKGLSCVVRGIADFGVRRPFVPGAPFQVVWDATYACNLNCQHCYAQAGRTSEDEISHEQALDIVDKLAAMGIPALAISGGEPLVRPDILDITRRAANKGMYVSIATNGTLITREKAKQMKDAGVSYLQISIDGADAQTHDAFRGIPGAFDRTIKGVKNSVAEGFFVSIATTVIKKNLDQVPKIIDLCDKLGANWFMAYNFIPTGRGKSIAENDLSPQEREDLLVMMYNKLKETEVEILTTAPQYARVALQQCQLGGPTIVPTHFMNTEVQGSLFNLTEFIGGCGAGRFYLAIRANGDVSPCVFFPLRVGNILTDDLEEIWKTNHVFEELRNKDVLEDNCGRCDYKYHCGGCRARAYGYFGDYKAADPGCINNVAKYNEMVQLLRSGPRKVE